MAVGSRSGTDWSRQELDLIVADYFTMLRDEQSGKTSRIVGYLPAWNYQSTIFDSIGDFLTRNPDPVPFAPQSAFGFTEAPDLLLEPPH